MPELRSILVPVDFSPGARSALEYAVFLAARFDAGIEVLHVHDPPFHIGDVPVQIPGNPPIPLADYIRERAEHSLDELIDGIDDRVPIRRRLAGGAVHTEILRVADEGEFDMIVMGTHGRSGIKRFLLGSVAELVLRKAHCPVVTVHLPSPEDSHPGDPHTEHPHP